MLLLNRARARARWLLVWLFAVSAIAGIAVASAGPFVARTPWGRISSRGADRPFIVAAAAAAIYVLAYRRYVRGDLEWLARRRWPAVLSWSAAAVTLLIGLGCSSFLAAGPDASGYVSQADMWGRGELVLHAPEWISGAPWPDAALTSSAVGYRPSPITPILVPAYAPGLPVLMASAQATVGAWGAFLVVPILAVVMVWATRRIGEQLAGPWAGALAAVLLASSPAFLIMLVQPMSDVPAAAFWTLAMVAALAQSRDAPLAAGLASAVGILIRPNLAPLAVAIAPLLAGAAGGMRDGLTRIGAYWAVCAPAALAVAMLNDFWYGSPLSSGYGVVQNLFSTGRVAENLAIYGRALLDTQTPLVALAFALPLLLPRRSPARRAASVLAVLVPVATLALYVPYERPAVWWFLRFLLPAYPALLGCAAAAVVLLVRHRTSPAVRAVATAIVIAVVIHGYRFASEEGVFGIKRADQRYLRAVQYVRTLPERSVLVSLVHSGTLRYYTGRDVLRWDTLESPYLDAAVAHLRQRGYAVYLVADEGEVAPFESRFSGAAVLRDIRPELGARIPGGVHIWPLAGSAPAVRR